MKNHPDDKVIEPERLRAIDSETGWEYPFRTSGDPIAMDELPRGDYFHHYTSVDNLTPIKMEGLHSSLETNQTQYGEPVPEKAEYRLYAWPQEKDCLGSNKLRNEARQNLGPQTGAKEIALRFPRKLFEGRPMWFDDRYGPNVWSIYTLDVTIPSTYLETCVSMRFLKGSYVGEWQPIV